MSRLPEPSASRVLIFRQGSLGDTLVALPCFHLIARSFPQAERRLLTNVPISRHVAPGIELLRQAGIVDGTIEYPMETRNPAALLRVMADIRKWRPDVLVYLVQARRRAQMARDWLFFRLCGIRRIVGLSLRGDWTNLAMPGTGLWESEARRLARTVGSLGDARLDSEASWDLRLDDTEHARAAAALQPLSECDGIVAFSLGTKWQPNDYGDENWATALAEFGRACPGLGLALVGAANESERSDRLARCWPGRSVNLCGRLSPRESGALLQRTSLFIGHDSGPMHLAASVGVRCVAVFSARCLPGIWFPRGPGHRILYRRVSCMGCDLGNCVAEAKRCILTIPPSEVADACIGALAEVKAINKSTSIPELIGIPG